MRYDMKINKLIWVRLITFSFFLTTACYACSDDSDTSLDIPTEEPGNGMDDIDVSGVTLKEAIGDKFLFGAAVNPWQLDINSSKEENRREGEVVLKHFNALVAESVMKWRSIHPDKEKYTFEDADAIVKFAEENGMTVIGHTLVWHTALPDWVWKDVSTGKDLSAEQLKENMRSHINTVVSRYKGRIKGWDVVNEAFNDDGTYRESPFYRILGKEYIPLAYQYAHEADPDAELYYNDFELYHSTKCRAVLQLIGELKAKGLPITAIGMQGHMWMNNPTVEMYENTILAFKSAGVKVMVTEWDMSVANGQNIYPNGLPKDVEAKWTQRMIDFFKLFLKYKDVVTRVSTWGVSDSHSWLNEKCTDYPLLFDRQQQPKPVVEMMIRAALADK